MSCIHLALVSGAGWITPENALHQESKANFVRKSRYFQSDFGGIFSCWGWKVAHKEMEAYCSEACYSWWDSWMCCKQIPDLIRQDKAGIAKGVSLFRTLVCSRRRQSCGYIRRSFWTGVKGQSFWKQPTKKTRGRLFGAWASTGGRESRTAGPISWVEFD